MSNIYYDDEVINARLLAAESLEATTDQLLAALDDDVMYVSIAAAENPNASVEVLESAIQNTRWWPTRRAAAAHKNATPKILTIAVGDNEPGVQEAAAKNLNADESILARAYLDQTEEVSIAAENNPRFTPAIRETAWMILINSPDNTWRCLAARDLRASEEVLLIALRDEEQYIREEAAGNPNAPCELLIAVMMDADEGAGKAAAENWQRRFASPETGLKGH